MEFNWDDFKNSYNNEQEARQGFTLLCEMIMQKHYPDFIAKNSDLIKEQSNTEDQTLDRKCIIYLPKYFLDGVSNSRKGQIRKALNDNLPYMKANKIDQWVLLMPLELSPDEKNWWENWSLRIKQENAITPTIILSSQLIDLIAKYGIEIKGTEKIIEQTSDGTVDFVFEEEPVADEPVVDAAVEDVVEEEASVAEPVVAESTTTVTETVVEEVVKPTVETVDVVVNDDDSTTTTTTTTTTTVTTVTTTETTAPEAQPADATPTEPEAPLPEPKPAVADTTAAREDMESVSDGDDDKTTANNDTLGNQNRRKKMSSNFKSASGPASEPTLNQLRRSFDFKQKFEDLETRKLALPEDGKDKGQRGVFDRRRDASNVKNYLNDFVFGDLSNFKGKELVKKAQIYVTNEQYSRGLYIYEYAYKKHLVGEEFMDEYKKGTGEAEFKLNYKYQMILGDLLFAQKDFINASDAYERAINLKTDFVAKQGDDDAFSTESNTYSPSIRDSEAETKYHEAKAEALLHINEYKEAADEFLIALAQNPENADLVQRYSLAQKLQRWSSIYNSKFIGWLTPLWAPFRYFFSVRGNKEIEDLKIAKTIRRRSNIGLVLWALIIGAAVALYFMWGRIGVASPVVDDSESPAAQAPVTPLELNICKGDYYMTRFCDDKPHFIDSAIYAYHRAIRFDNTDTIAKPLYNRAMTIRSNYVAQIQQNIHNDSATYFLSMRRPTEGLRLFKYKYDPRSPEKGKFGFVDTLGNIVIPPFYDFNYRTMDEQGETFYNGRAKVCLEVSPYDTIYFYIDQRGNKIEE